MRVACPVHSLPPPESPHPRGEPAAGDRKRAWPGEGSRTSSAAARRRGDRVSAAERSVLAPRCSCWEARGPRVAAGLTLTRAHHGRHRSQLCSSLKKTLDFFQNLLFLGEKFGCIHKAWVLFSS